MAEVEILKGLEDEINRKFKKESIEIFQLLYSLENNPKKGKFLAQVGGVAVKELKYKNFRFYFLVDNYKVRFLRIEDLKDMFIKFVRMSDKKNQQKTIEEIKVVLKRLGEEGF